MLWFIIISFVALLISNRFMSEKKAIPNPNPFPTYFISHGGPSFMYKDEGVSGAYDAIKKLGSSIKNELKPDYIIVVSAHWQSGGSNLIEIAVPPKGPSRSKLLDKKVENPLVYDFYGFPDHMYQEEFHTKSSIEVAQEIKLKLQDDFEVKITERGIDHGVWVPFQVAFSDFTTKTVPQPKEIGWDLPDTKVIQVSLTHNSNDFDSHFKLGKALDFFRKNSIWDETEQRHLTGLIIGSGMSVHNLRDLRYTFEGRLAPYTKPFGDLISQKILNTDSRNLLPQFNELLLTKYRNLLYLAHPTLEHFVPLVVVGGVASNSNDKASEIFNEYTGSLAWAIYEFK